MGDTASARAIASQLDPATLARALLGAPHEGAKPDHRQVIVETDHEVVGAALRGGPSSVDWWASHALLHHPSCRIKSKAALCQLQGDGTRHETDSNDATMSTDPNAPLMHATGELPSMHALGAAWCDASQCGVDEVVRAFLGRHGSSRPSPLRVWVLDHSVSPSIQLHGLIRKTAESVLRWICVRDVGGTSAHDGATRDEGSSADSSQVNSIQGKIVLHPHADRLISQCTRDAALLLQAAAGASGVYADERLMAMVRALTIERESGKSIVGEYTHTHTHSSQNTCAHLHTNTHNLFPPFYAGKSLSALDNGHPVPYACAPPAHVAVASSSDAAHRLSLLLGLGPPGKSYTPRVTPCLQFTLQSV